MLQVVLLLVLYSISLSIYAGGQLHHIDSYQALEAYIKKIQNSDESSESLSDTDSSDSSNESSESKWKVFIGQHIDAWFDSDDSDGEYEDDSSVLTKKFLLQMYVDVQGLDADTSSEIKDQFKMVIDRTKKKSPHLYKKWHAELLSHLVAVGQKNTFNDQVSHQKRSIALKKTLQSLVKKEDKNNNNIDQDDIWKQRMNHIRNKSSLQQLIIYGNKAILDQFEESNDCINSHIDVCRCLLLSNLITATGLIITGTTAYTLCNNYDV